MPVKYRSRPNPESPARRVTVRGAVARLMRECRDPELVIDGPYGTGKTRGILEYIHRLLLEHSDARALLIRKTLTSLTSSALVTFREQVVQSDEAVFFGGSKDRPPAFQYTNGSELLVGGMDRPDKVLSTEYDLIYCPECTELTEGEWEVLGGRLRHGRLPFHQLLGDCNPQGPNHWVKRRAERGQLTMMATLHADNPAYHDGRQWTPAGLAYIGRLQTSLTGVRRARGLEGRWVAAEGIIYEGWSDASHLVDRFEYPGVWPRYWVIDFGYVNPFVWQEWVQDNDGRLYLSREIYRTGRLVEDHARLIRSLMDQPPVAIICDHDAEDRATLERHLEMRTIAAQKSVSPGIQAVQARLRPAGDGKPRLYLMRDATLDRDAELVDAHKPASTAEEWDGYIWETATGQRKGEAPHKENDHGMDCTRYLVAHIDGIGRGSGGASEVINGRTGQRVSAATATGAGRRAR